MKECEKKEVKSVEKKETVKKNIPTRTHISKLRYIHTKI